MTNQRKFLHPGQVHFKNVMLDKSTDAYQVRKSIFLRGRLYSARQQSPKTVSIYATCCSADPQNFRFPCLEGIIEGSHVQPFIHDIYVLHRSTLFRVFFKRHTMLPYNKQLGIQGDVVVMRVASRNRHSVVNLRPSDRRIADLILRW